MICTAVLFNLLIPLKNWCFWTVVLEKTLQSPLDCKEIQPVHPKGDQSWVFIGRIDAEPEAPIFWPSDVKNWLIGKDPDAKKDWRQEEKGTTEDGVVGWHHWLDRQESEEAPGVDYGQGGLACCSPWGRKESDVIKWVNWSHKFTSLFPSWKGLFAWILWTVLLIFSSLSGWSFLFFVRHFLSSFPSVSTTQNFTFTLFIHSS